MLSTAMTNDVVGGGGTLTPAPPFKNVGFGLAGRLFCDVNGNQGLMTVARRAAWLPPWLAGRPMAAPKIMMLMMPNHGKQIAFFAG